MFGHYIYAFVLIHFDHLAEYGMQCLGRFFAPPSITVVVTMHYAIELACKRYNGEITSTTSHHYTTIRFTYVIYCNVYQPKQAAK